MSIRHATLLGLDQNGNAVTSWPSVATPRASYLRHLPLYVPELIAALEEYIAHHNDRGRPYVWTAKAADVLAKMLRARRALAEQSAVYLFLTHYTRVPLQTTRRVRHRATT